VIGKQPLVTGGGGGGESHTGVHHRLAVFAINAQCVRPTIEISTVSNTHSQAAPAATIIYLKDYRL